MENNARLSLEPTRARQRMLDGAWWPRTYDAETELPALVAALIAGKVSVTRIGLRRGAWESAPETVASDGRVVRVYWHGPQDIHAISVTADGQRRLDILVVPPQVTAAPAAGPAVYREGTEDISNVGSRVGVALGESPVRFQAGDGPSHEHQPKCWASCSYL